MTNAVVESRTAQAVELGLGLIAIGRPWGFVKTPLPSDAESKNFLTEAVQLGVRFFDTAPSYGLSERRLGAFLKTLPASELRQLTIATKFGEHWDEDSNQLYVDHSYDALSRSFDRSMQVLGKIDILQVHKTEAWVLRERGVRDALTRAASSGVRQFGASVKDVESAQVALTDDLFSWVQLPFNRSNASLEKAFKLANLARKRIIVNRPFGMGELLYQNGVALGRPEQIRGAFEAILKRDFSGIVLTGTRSVEHLRENIEAFHRARP
jgi:aryl-alcohol dehydrogenase-like predicted oxidoreductase